MKIVRNQAISHKKGIFKGYNIRTISIAAPIGPSDERELIPKEIF